MKNIIIIISTLLLLIGNSTVNAAVDKESTRFWYKGYGIANSYARSPSSESYIGTNFEWAVVTVHSFNDSNNNGIDRVRVFAREESPTYLYPNATVRTLSVLTGIKDNEGTAQFVMGPMLPLEKTFPTVVKPAWYDLLGLIPWKGSLERIIPGLGYVLDAFSNVFSASISHWKDPYANKGQVKFSHPIKIDNLNMDNYIPAREADAYSDYEFDNRGTGKGATGIFHFNYGGFPNYSVRAFGQVVYRVQTEYGNGITYDLKSGFAIKDHLINAQ